jgi:hypothetical protein
MMTAKKYFLMSKNPLSKKRKEKERTMEKKRVFTAFGIVLVLLLSAVIAIYVISNLPQKVQEVSVKKLENGDYQLMVGTRPYFVKGVCYIPTPIGKGYDYDLWSDPCRPWLVDGRLMKDMGVNTVRFYFHSKDPEKGRGVIRTLYNQFGIRSALGHYLNFWDYPPPNYGLAEVRKRIREDVIKMVRDYKDEPGILFWILGNENNYSFDRNVNPWTTDDIEKLTDPLEKRKAKAEIYYKFVNDLAREIKRIDPNHPVVMGNGELASIKVAKRFCPDVDILGGIIYTGRTLGSFWKQLKRNFGKPAVMIEFGCDRYNAYTQREDEDHQALFLKTQWLEIVKNSAGGHGEGNSLGGFIFEWTDEWWKHNEQFSAGWRQHDTEGSWSQDSYYFDAEAENNMNEEWWGIVGLSEETVELINKRVPKKAYYILKRLWRK